MKGFVNQLKGISHAIRIFIKRIFTYISFTTLKISKNTTRGKASFVEN